MLPPINLGQIAISSDTPTGHDPRDLPEYETMLNEIAKISSLQGESTINWEKVEHTATIILKNYAKDIPTATYLCIALSQNYGFTGWYTGTTILIDMLNTWWDNAFPPLNRMRARVNSIDWWHDRTILFFSTCKEQITPDLFKELDNLVSGMDNIIKTLLPDASLLFNLHKVLYQISVIASPLSIITPMQAQDDSQANTLTSHTLDSKNDTSQTMLHSSSTHTTTVPVQMTAAENTAMQSTVFFASAQQYFFQCFDINSTPKIMTAALT